MQRKAKTLINHPLIHNPMQKKSYFAASGGRKWGSEGIVEVNSRDSLLEALLSPDGKDICLKGSILPPRYHPLDNASKRLLCGAEPLLVEGSVILPRPAIEEALLSATKSSLAVYAFRRSDKTSTRIALDDVLFGAKLFAYSENLAKIEVNVYDSCKDAETKGAKARVRVPSRAKRQSRHQFVVSNIPITESSRHLWRDINAGCPCEYKQNLILNFKTSDRFMCMHEIAALYAIASYYNEQKNRIVADALPFFYVSRELASIWKRLHRVRKGEKKGMLTKAELSLAVGDAIQQLKERAFKVSGKYKDYEW